MITVPKGEADKLKGDCCAGSQLVAPGGAGPARRHAARQRTMAGRSGDTRRSFSAGGWSPDFRACLGYSSRLWFK